MCSMADEAAGEVPVAFVVRANGAYITELEIKSYIAKQVLQHFIFPDKLILHLSCLKRNIFLSTRDIMYVILCSII